MSKDFLEHQLIIWDNICILLMDYCVYCVLLWFLLSFQYLWYKWYLSFTLDKLFNQIIDSTLPTASTTELFKYFLKI